MSTRKLNTYRQSTSKPEWIKVRRGRKQSKATKALKMVRQLKKAVETHKIDQNGAIQQSCFDYPGYGLSNIQEGDTSSARNGLRIYAKTLALNYEVQWSADANKTDEAIRVMVVKDKMGNGSATPPLTSDILEVANTYSTLCQRNNTTEGKRYQVLYDKVHTNPNQDATNTYTKVVRKMIPIKCPIYYLGSTSANTDKGRNNLWLYLIGDQSLASALSPLVRFTNRLYFDP